MKKIVFFAVFFGYFLIMIILHNFFPHSLNTEYGLGRALSLGIFLTLITSSIILSKPNLAKSWRPILAWSIIIFVITFCFSYKNELNLVWKRVEANLIPGFAEKNADGSVSFYAGEGGHFTITAMVNDKEKIDFLFDTGSTDIALMYRLPWNWREAF